MESFVCTSCFRKGEESELKWWANRQVCDRCYFKYIKYDRLRSDLNDEERKKILDELLSMEEKKYGNDV